MVWERYAVAVLAAIGGLTLIGWAAHAVLRRGRTLRPGISVSMTVRDAAPEIEGVVRSLIFFGRAVRPWVLKRIAIIDKGSTDETAVIVRRLAEKNPIVQYLTSAATPLENTIELVTDATAGWTPREAGDAICSLLT